MPRRPSLATPIALALALGLGACSVATPPQVRTLTRPAQSPAAVRIEPAQPENAAAARFAATLAAALAAKGIAIRDESPFALTLALARRPASLGLAGQEPAPRKHHLLHACRAERVVVSLEGGPEGAETAFAARGSFDACVATPQGLASLAEALAAALAGG